MPGHDEGVWAARAAAAERAVLQRHLRRVGGVVPATGLGRIAWPRQRWLRPGPRFWHYWWQAHLLDCLVDAQHRAPSRRRERAIRALLRGVWLRNHGTWVNPYFDDMAWLGLAAQRAGPLGGVAARRALDEIVTQLQLGWTEHGGGGIWWRLADDFKNVPTNGPAAILLARTGHVELAASLVDWMAERLVDPGTGLVMDGLRVAPDGTVRAREPAVYTYCQGVYLGACVELSCLDVAPRWAERAAGVLAAIDTGLAGTTGVLPGQGGGDGGLFAAILARYLADAAMRSPELAGTASRLVLASAEAAWAGVAAAPGGPLFGPDWRVAAVPGQRGAGPAEHDLSVQLGGWMVLEAAARLASGRRIGPRPGA